MTRTASCDYLCDFADDSDRTLRSLEDADTSSLARIVPKWEDLHPRDTKWTMWWQEKWWLKSYTIVFDAYTDTSIIPAKFLEAHGRGYHRTSGHFTVKEPLPATPTWDMIGDPWEYRPQSTYAEYEHEKYFHRDIVLDIFPYCKSLFFGKSWILVSFHILDAFSQSRIRWRTGEMFTVCLCILLHWRFVIDNS